MSFTEALIISITLSVIAFIIAPWVFTAIKHKYKMRLMREADEKAKTALNEVKPIYTYKVYLESEDALDPHTVKADSVTVTHYRTSEQIAYLKFDIDGRSVATFFQPVNCFIREEKPIADKTPTTKT